MADTAVLTEPEIRPLARSRWRFAAVLIAVALVVAPALWWWSGTGAHLEPGGNRASVVTAVGVPLHFGYDLSVEGGTMTIDDVRLADPSDGITAEFSIATGPCPIGATAYVPETCDLVPVHGQVVSDTSSRWLVATYTLDGPGARRPGEVVVRYHDGLHRRSTNLRYQVCLATVDATPGCEELFATLTRTP